MSLIDYVRKTVYGFLEKYDYLKRQSAIVIEYNTSGKTRLRLTDGKEITLLNKTGELLSIGDNVLIYYWTKISSGYVGFRFGKTSNYIAAGNKYLINENHTKTITRYEYQVKPYTQDGGTAYVQLKDLDFVLDFQYFSGIGCEGSENSHGLSYTVLDKDLNSITYSYELYETATGKKVFEDGTIEEYPIYRYCWFKDGVQTNSGKMQFSKYDTYVTSDIKHIALFYTRVQYDHDTKISRISFTDAPTNSGVGLVTMKIQGNGGTRYLAAPVQTSYYHANLMYPHFVAEQKTDTRYTATKTETTEDFTER